MKRSILSLMYLIQAMRKAEIDVDQQLSSIGLSADALDSTAIIHPRLERDVLKVLGQNIAPERGLYIGQHYALAGYGPLLMLLVTSDTIRTALEKVIAYQPLTHLTAKLSLKFQNHQVALCYDAPDLTDELNMLRAQSELAGTYKFIRELYKKMGLAVPQLKVELPFAPPENSEILSIYQAYCGAEIVFSQQQAAFWFDETVLDIKIPSADQMTFRIYDYKCKAEMKRLLQEPALPDLVERVHDYLDLQHGSIPTMAETAQALHIPERTLRHQLQQLNSSYKQIREQLIKEKALRLIEYQEYTIEMIAELLGYSEPAAFNHAFKRWFGRSPRQYSK
ncbi:AraC family transcriptional regulator [Acinetobacter sp. GXMZU3951]